MTTTEHARLSARQREAMQMLQAARQNYTREEQSGATTSSESHLAPGSWPALINWRTAQGLARRGLLTYEYIGPDEGAALTLTDAGLAWKATR